MRSIKFPPFLQTNFKPSCWNVLDPNIHGVLHLVWSSMLHSDVNFRKRGKGLEMVNVVIPSFITRYIYTWIKMINLISNHEKGSFLNSCDVVTSARPFNQLKCVKKLDKINVVLNHFYPSCPFLCLLYRFLLKVAVNGFLFLFIGVSPTVSCVELVCLTVSLKFNTVSTSSSLVEIFSANFCKHFR